MGNDFGYTAHNTPSTASFYGIISVSTVPGGVFGRGGRIGWCWAGKEGFGICFSVFLSAIAGVGFIGGDWALGYVSTKI